MATHDSGYKQLFSHPEMVRDLLRDWVPGEWTAELDYSTLERINSSYVAENQKQRHDDMVWRVRHRDQWLWIYLLLEFQSEPDPWMALRLLVYVGLLSQDLVKRGELSEQQQLPPIFPLVLYNGLPEWRAATQLSGLYAPPPRGMEAYQAQLRYHLIDEARLKLHPLSSVRSAVEALFQLEHGRSPDDLRRVIQALAAMLSDPEHTQLRRTFTLWIKQLLRRKIKPVSISELDRINDLMEADTMLAERIESWFEEAERKGLQKGRQEGQARVLGKLLQLKFGALSADVQAQLDSAGEAQLEAWTEAVLTATTLEAVLERRAPSQ